ncbi:MAG: hypothetical protein WAV25_01960 [Minisyncoccia bacterium]
MFKRIYNFFDKLEDKVRSHLSRSPIIYGFVGGIGVILFWRGVWHTADQYPFMTGPVTTLIGAIILLLSGVFVSVFVGNRLILTGLLGEKKLTEKTEDEINAEEAELKKVERTMRHIESEIDELKKDLK